MLCLHLPDGVTMISMTPSPWASIKLILAWNTHQRRPAAPLPKAPGLLPPQRRSLMQVPESLRGRKHGGEKDSGPLRVRVARPGMWLPRFTVRPEPATPASPSGCGGRLPGPLGEEGSSSESLQWFTHACLCYLDLVQTPAWLFLSE